MRISADDLRRIVVAIDPAVTHGETADETGIVVVGRGPHQPETCRLADLTGRCPGHGYVLADVSARVAPHEWARRAVKAYDAFKADRIIAEVNNGGDMVGETIHAIRAGVPYTAVNASRGKHKRAEPVAALWEQGRMHFAVACPQLEDELTSWEPDSTWSPNRLDALVWGCTALGLIGGQGQAFLAFWRGEIATREREAAQPTPTRSDATAVRQLKRLMRSGPQFGTASYGPTPAQRRCEHRWRGDYCVFCSLTRAAV